MTKSEYINGLQAGLQGEVTQQVLRESVDYYSRYIDDEIAGGKSEQQVLEELGPVQLIVKTIIEANKGTGEEETQRTRAQEQRNQSTRQSQNQSRSSGFTLNSWYGKLILILIALLILALIIGVVVIIVMAAWYLLPVVAVIALIVILLRVFIGRKR